MTADAERRGGIWLGLTAYAMWGVFPLYWPLLKPALAVEILGHRIVWSFIFLAIAASLRRGWGLVRAVLAEPRARRLLAVAALLVSVNWGLYIWAVNAHHVVETALGYFINPLVSVLFGVVLLKERLTRMQWVAIAVAAAAVLALTIDYGRLPWIALTLAFSFGGYGLAKKLAGVDAYASLTVETAIITPVALILMGVLAARGDFSFGSQGAGHSVLLALTGPITAIPLLFFGASARRVPLSTLGIMQYVAPTIQFLIGITVAGEHMPTSRWFGFAGVWLALALFTWSALRPART
ncbi:MAG: EamA family transporter RarD [Actinobacteria bacterium]|nr:EamA family transporter RarD [Actinomycetota bacterium]